MGIRSPKAGNQLAHLNLKILSPLALFVRERRGENCLETLAKDCGLDHTNLGGRNEWGSLEQIEAFLAGVRNLVADDEEFKVACAYKIKQSYGPMAFLARGTSPAAAWKSAVNTMPSFSSISRYEILEAAANRLLIQYVSQKPESRLMCLSRQAQGAALTTLWGLPPAHYNEKSCIARGDDACVYEIVWYQHRRMTPPVLGTLLGGIAATSAAYFGVISLEAAIFASILSGSLASSWELRRTNKANLKIVHELDEVVHKLATDDAEARREILALTQRHEEWARLMEQLVSEHAAVRERLSTRMRSLQNAQQASLRGFSHDMRNPLLTLKMSLQYLEQNLRTDLSEKEEPREVIREMKQDIHKLNTMVTDLVELAASEHNLLNLKPKAIPIDAIAQQLHRRLKALTYGKSIDVFVDRSQHAPGSINIDPLLLDRIVDNLVTNAAKYTQRGRIHARLRGDEAFLTIELSDTGCGIEKRKLSKIFRPRGLRRSDDAGLSFGLGLSMVVKLLACIGGKLEVASKQLQGTTIWLHLPVKPREPTNNTEQPVWENTSDDLINSVVTIRPFDRDN